MPRGKSGWNGVQWPGTVIERHKALLKTDGLSHSQAARVITKEFRGLGRVMTRNASIGLASRQGYGNGHRPGNNRQSRIWGPKPKPRPKPPKPAIPPDAPEPVLLDVLQLTNHTCKWPVTDLPPHLFCGHAVQDGDGPPYCPFHRGLSGNGHGTGRRHTPETLAAMRRAHARRLRWT